MFEIGNKDIYICRPSQQCIVEIEMTSPKRLYHNGNHLETTYSLSIHQQST